MSTKKRRILKEFTIGEISVVDDPAQAGSTVTIMKRAQQFHEVVNPKLVQHAKDLFHENVAKATTEHEMKPEEIKPETIDQLAKAIQLRYGSAPADAYKSAVGMLEDPALAAKMMPRLVPCIEAAHSMAKLAKGEGGDFDKHVAEIRSRDKCSRTVAMSKARQEFPAEYEAYQSA